MLRQGLRHSELKRRRRRTRIIRLGLALLLLALLAAGVLWSLRLPALRVQSVDVSGTSVLSPDDLRAFVFASFDGEYLSIIPKGSMFFHPSGSIERGLLASYPRLLSADLSRSGLRNLSLSVSERRPFALWCSGEAGAVAASSTVGCAFLDEDGFAFANAPEFSGNPFRVFYGLLDEGSAVGSALLPKDEFQSLARFVNSLPDLSLAPRLTELRENGEASVLLESGVSILLSRKLDLTRSFENLGSAIRAGDITPENFATLDYIDLRFGDRVFYKYR